MTNTSTLETARSLAARWNGQQTGYIRHRAERFDTIARVVAAGSSRRCGRQHLDALLVEPARLGAAHPRGECAVEEL